MDESELIVDPGAANYFSVSRTSIPQLVERSDGLKTIQMSVNIRPKFADIGSELVGIAKKSTASVSVEGGMVVLTVTAPSGYDIFHYYLTEHFMAREDDWIFETATRESGNTYLVTGRKPNVIPAKRTLRGADLNPDSDQCVYRFGGGTLETGLEGTRCQQPEGHAWGCRSVGDDYDLGWGTDGLTLSHSAPYGYIEKCVKCGKVEAFPTDEYICRGCRYWLDKIERGRKNPNFSFVVKGKHYCVGKGFGERRFKLRNIATGLEFATGLMGQGKIPSHFRNDLPDTHVFVGLSAP